MTATDFAVKVVALVVMILMIATVLIPVVSSSQEVTTREIFYNDFDSFRMETYTEDVTIVYDGSQATQVNDVVITVNGVTYPDLTGTSYYAHFGLYSDNIIARFQSATYSNYIMFFTIFEAGTSSTASFFNDVCTVAFDSAAGKLSVSFAESSQNDFVVDATYLAGPTTKTGENVYSYIHNGNAWPSVKVNQDLIDNHSFGLLSSWKGNLTINEQSVGTTVVVNEYQAVAWTDDNNYDLTVVLDYQDLELIQGSSDVYSGGTPHLKIYYNDEQVGDIVPSRCYVLTDVPGHVTVSTESSLLGIIPLLLIVACVLIAVGLLRGRS